MSPHGQFSDEMHISLSGMLAGTLQESAVKYARTTEAAEAEKWL